MFHVDNNETSSTLYQNQIANSGHQLLERVCGSGNVTTRGQPPLTIHFYSNYYHSIHWFNVSWTLGEKYVLLLT